MFGTNERHFSSKLQKLKKFTTKVAEGGVGKNSNIKKKKKHFDDFEVSLVRLKQKGIKVAASTLQQNEHKTSFDS